MDPDGVTAGEASDGVEGVESTDEDVREGVEVGEERPSW